MADEETQTETVEPTAADLAGLFGKFRDAEAGGEQPDTDERSEDDIDPVGEPEELEADEEEIHADSEELEGDPDESEDNAGPIIQAPVGMSAQDAAAFAKAPPEVQAWMVQQEANRSANLTQKTQEIANERKRLEAQSAELTQIIERQKAALSPIVDQDIQPPDPKLRLEDPEQFDQEMAQYTYAKHQQEQAQKQLEAAQGEQGKIQEEQALAFIRERDADLVRRVPDLADEKKGAKNVADLRSYVVSQGILPEEHVNAATAAMAEAFWKAMLYDRAIAAGSTASKKSKKAPKAQKPGAAKNPKSTAQTRDRAKRFEDIRTKASKGAASRHDLAAAFGAFRGR